MRRMLRMKTNWINKFKKRFLEILYHMPAINTLSFSGGIESSAILFGLIEVANPPFECVTFKVGGVETDDTFFARKICKHYNIPLEVVNIPILSKEKLIQEVQEIIKTIKIVRNIDIQCCHAYKYMIPKMGTNKLITGFYEDIHYEANKKLMIMYRDMIKGIVDEKFFNQYYQFGKACIYHGQNRSGTIHNYKVIERYLQHCGIKMFFPFKDRELFSITQKLTFHETNFYEDKFRKKWFITEKMFKDQFDYFGNAKNSNNMHTQGLKQYHRKVLLDKTSHKDTIAVYNRIKNFYEGKRDINEAISLF
jgi:hypothetical protein